MKEAGSWRPSKYVRRGGTLRASRDQAEVGVASRLVADLVAASYDRYVPLYAHGRLVDLGCGKAPLYGTYKAHASSVTCVDWGNSVHPNPHLDMQANLSEPLPFADGEFDTIILSDVLEHIAEPAGLWDEMVRILSPGGRLLMNVPFLYCIHESPHDYYRFTSFALRRFAEARGMSVLVLEPVGGGLEVLADTIAKQLQIVPLVGGPLASAVQAFVWAVRRTALGKRAADASGRVMPLGYFMVARKASAIPG